MIDTLEKFLHNKAFILLALPPLIKIKISAKILLKLIARFSTIITILTLSLLLIQRAYSQNDSTIANLDTLNESTLNDSISMGDSLSGVDSTNIDTLPKKKKSAIDDPVLYSSNDSMMIVIDESTVLLWGQGKVEYQDIVLESDYISSNLERQEIAARGSTDTLGHYNGTPKFKKGDEEFESDSILYNTKSGKGLIYSVKTEEGEGYLHSELTKRNDDGTIHIKGGKYTTCDLDHPHFYIALTKAIAIPDDKIISGPAYLVVEDVPIPFLGLPFGFFPSSSNRGAGVILPTYGEEQNRGFYLKGGGWYQPLGQYVDATILGDIYSKGSWALEFGTSYKVRYKFSGSMNFDYAENKDNSDKTFAESKDFAWKWSHRQDAKANPYSTFSASVNFSSSSYDKNNATSISQATTNQKTSSISYSKTFSGTPFNLSLSANAKQNSSDSTVTLVLPQGSFSASTVYPFRKKNGSGDYKWYENIGLSYTANFKNQIYTIDTMLFESETWENLNYGFQHTVPFVINLKTDKIKMLTISPSLSYKGVMNSWYQHKHAEYDEYEEEWEIITDTIWKPTYAHAINPSISVGLTPKITGMYMNTRKDPKVIAVRHVMQPRASFSYTPDMSFINPNYYDTVFYNKDGVLKHQVYSYYGGNLYGSPSSNGQSGSLSLGLSNTLEAKLKPENDTAANAEPRKVSILKSFNFSTSYNPFAEEFKWSNISLTASSSLFKNFLSLNMTSAFSLYDFTSDTSKSGTISYSKVEEFYFDNGKGLMRFTKLSLSSSFSLKSKEDKSGVEGNADKENPNQGMVDNLESNPIDAADPFASDYVDFNVPWSLKVSYSYSLSRPYTKAKQTVTNTATFSGDISLTPRWKVGFTSGYDFEDREINITTINIYRDLHCWEMRMTTVPFGTYRSYSFTISAKASILQDLKLDKKDGGYYDNF